MHSVIRPIARRRPWGESVSTLRKTVLTTAIIGAGLASTAGSAFATDCGHDNHHQKSHQSSSSSSDCTNNVKALNATKGGSFADIAGGAQTIIPVNACHILDNNKIANGNKVALFGDIF
jgi:hypothetical protein